MLNRIIIMGRLTRDPELKYTQSGVPVCTVTLACERSRADASGQRQADFIDVVVWRGVAEFVCRWFKKGQLAACEGRLQSRKWTDANGSNRVSWEVSADGFFFAERAQAEGAPPKGSFDAAVQAAQEAGVTFSGWVDDDEDVPF